MSESISPEVRACIDAHLDAVESQLSAALMPREKRRGIVDDLETHILDLAAAAPSQPVTAPQIQEILARLDPPEAYRKEEIAPTAPTAPASPAPTGPPALAGPPMFSREAKRGAVWIALALTAQVVFVLGTFTQSAQIGGPSRDAVPAIWMSGFILLILLLAVAGPIIGTSLGWTAIARIRKSGGTVHGMPLAAFDALFYPFILLWLACFTLWYWIIVAYYDGPEIPNRGRAVEAIGGSLTAVAATVAIGLILWRRWSSQSGPLA